MTDIREYVAERLDQRYVRQVARDVAQAVRDGVPIEVCFQPGDGTRYDLLFVPVHELRAARGRAVEGQSDWDHRCAFGVSRHVGATVVAWTGHGAAGLDLACGGFVGEYLAELYGTTLGSGAALEMLLDAVAETLS